MVWEDPPCLTLHDRSDGAFHLPYAIPFEDLDRWMDRFFDATTVGRVVVEVGNKAPARG